jgi:hypothetical protein
MVVFSSLQAAEQSGFGWFARDGEYDVVFVDRTNPRSGKRERALALARRPEAVASR